MSDNVREYFAGVGSILQLQDDCLIAALRRLPPWRAVLIARVATRGPVGLEFGTPESLIDEAQRVGGKGQLTDSLGRGALDVGAGR